jgi:hypothetical protein
MAKRPGRPKIDVIRIVAGAVLDGVRRAVVITPMAAVAFASPWLVLFELIRSFPRSSEAALAGLGLTLVSIVTLGVAMQSLLAESASTDLRRIRPNWSLDLVATGRRFIGDLVVSLIGLGLSSTAAVIGGVAVGVSWTAIAPGDGSAVWWAIAAAALAMVPAAVLQSPWAVAIPVSHVEGVGLASALQRSVVLTRGQRLRISIPQAAYLAAWPGAFAAFAYGGIAFHLRGQASEVALALLFSVLGVLAAIEALGKVRLYRELAAVEGAVGASTLAEVFE